MSQVNICFYSVELQVLYELLKVATVCTAHVYNVARRRGSLRKHWRDIDYVIDLHTDT